MNSPDSCADCENNVYCNGLMDCLEQDWIDNQPCPDDLRMIFQLGDPTEAAYDQCFDGGRAGVDPGALTQGLKPENCANCKADQYCAAYMQCMEGLYGTKAPTPSPTEPTTEPPTPAATPP